MQRSTIFRNFIFLNLLIIFCVKSIFACDGSIPPVCEAFADARNVFAGKLIKIEKSDSDGSNIIIAHFEVFSTYKGKIDANHFIKFGNSDCGIIFVEGESYLVFETKEIMGAYERILPLSAAKKDIEYIKSLSQENPQFMIMGELQPSPYEQLGDVKIFVEEGDNIYELEFDKYYYFEFKTTKPAKYKLKIIVPFNAKVELGDFATTFYQPKIKALPDKTILETEFDFKPNNCVDVKYWISEAEIKQKPL